MKEFPQNVRPLNPRTRRATFFSLSPSERGEGRGGVRSLVCAQFRMRVPGRGAFARACS
jgi:hypothetical protein